MSVAVGAMFWSLAFEAKGGRFVNLSRFLESEGLFFFDRFQLPSAVQLALTKLLTISQIDLNVFG